MANWDNDMIQFPRLLAEIMATQDKIDFKALAESMDLTEDNVHELFDRAQLSWEAIKSNKAEIRKDQTLLHGETMWVTVGNLSAYLKHGDDGVSFSVYKDGKEMEDSLVETWCAFAEGDENE